MKKRKLKLQSLQLASFVTDFDQNLEETVIGGISSSPEALRSILESCPTNLLACPENITAPTMVASCI